MTKRTILHLLLALALVGGAYAQTPAPAAKAAAAPASSAKIPVANVEASAAAKENALQLSTFTVSEQQDLGYESMQTTSGMRTVQELKNVANSISIINAQFIEDIGAMNLDEMSRWFVTGEANPDPALPNKGIFRGVVNNYAVRNGWIWYSPMESSFDRARGTPARTECVPRTEKPISAAPTTRSPNAAFSPAASRASG
jgi:hypothetical protein